MLKKESERSMFAKQAIKDSLLAELQGWIREQNLKPAEVTEIFGTPCFGISDLISNKAAEMTIDQLVDMMLRAGKHIQVSVEY